MKLFTVFVSFAPPPRDVIVVIIPYKEEAEQMKLFTFFVSFAPPLPPILKLFVCFVSFAPPLPPILTHIVTHEEKIRFWFSIEGSRNLPKNRLFPFELKITS